MQQSLLQSTEIMLINLYWQNHKNCFSKVLILNVSIYNLIDLMYFKLLTTHFKEARNTRNFENVPEIGSFNFFHLTFMKTGSYTVNKLF